MLIRLAWVGRTRDPAAAALIERYRERLAHHLNDRSVRSAARTA